jgi:phosphate transport system substrate-binding protein
MSRRDKFQAMNPYAKFLLLLLVSLCLRSVIAQDKPHALRKIYVDTFPNNPGSRQLREDVLERLRTSHEVTLTNSSASADFVVRGNGETWLKGNLAVNPRSAPSVREPVYGGYLSLEVANKDGDVLWSYLVTPGRVHWNGVSQDMANHIVRLLLTALRQPNMDTAEPLAATHGQITLSGAGSTFAAPLYQSWIDSFEQRRTGVHATYQAVGSENGIQLFEHGKVDFAASDIPFSDQQLVAMPIKFSQYATVLGGVVPAYNLAGVGRDLRFTPDVLADIYLGKIAKWNDPKLRALNHGASLPDAPIVVLHRSDGSGTTFAWTQFLSKASPAWKSTVDSGMHVEWPTGAAATGNEGVANAIASTPNAIGYVELTYAIRHKLSFGLVRNAAGRFIQANLDTLSEAALGASASGDLRASLIDAPGKDAYPIASFTWILVPATQNGPKSAALADLVQWMLTSGQKDCSALGYVPLPKEVATKELAQSHAVNATSAANERIRY